MGQEPARSGSAVAVRTELTAEVSGASRVSCVLCVCLWKVQGPSPLALDMADGRGAGGRLWQPQLEGGR